MTKWRPGWPVRISLSFTRNSMSSGAWTASSDGPSWVLSARACMVASSEGGRRAARAVVRWAGIRGTGRIAQRGVARSHGLAVRRHLVWRAFGACPFLPDLFQPYRVFVVEASDQPVGDEDRQQAQAILEGDHDDSLIGAGRCRDAQARIEWGQAKRSPSVEVRLICSLIHWGFLASRASIHSGGWRTA